MKPRSLGLGLVLALWLAGVAGGLAWMLHYANTPAALRPAPGRWPEGGPAREPDRPTLVMFVHPHCPCSQASVGELAELMALHSHRVAARVAIYRPADAAPSWGDTSVRAAAGRIPGVRLVEDVGGAESRRFRASTSGEVVLYDRDGALVFQGGITPARGHLGDNLGRETVQERLTCPCRRGEPASARVFGCSLDRPASADPARSRG